MTQINDRLLELIIQTATGGNNEGYGRSTFEFTETAIQEFTDLVIEDVIDNLTIDDWKGHALARLKLLISHAPSKKIRRKRIIAFQK